MMRIITSKEERNAKRSQTSVLCVALLHIANSLDKLLDGHVFVVLGQVRLRCVSAVVD